jgi:kumamolisin
MALLALPGTAGAASGGPLAGAARVGATAASTELQLVFPLRADLAGLRRQALAVSTPGNPAYGHFASIRQLARRFGASRTTSARTIAFLRHAGARQVKLDATGLFVDASLRAGTAERLFATTLAEFRAANRGTFTAPTVGTPSLPAGLRGLATDVIGLSTQPVVTSANQFARERAARASIVRARRASPGINPLAHATAQTASGYSPATGLQSGCDAAKATGSFTPNQYLTAYGYAPLQAAGLTGQGERVALIEIDGFKHSDIATFAGCFGLRVPQINSFGVGLNKPLPPGGEATLDLEVMTAAAPGLKAIDVYESNADEASALKALTSPLQGRAQPQVISASLGLCEPFVYQAVKRKGLESTEGALEMAAAAGISFLDSSGDAGSADCTQGQTPIPHLAVNYPTSSWWVTGVGGTNIALNQDNTLAIQVVWNDADLQPGSAGGGGKSILFNRPPYQHDTVVPNTREVPDVSMLADVAPGYAIYCSASKVCVSPSSPNPWQGIGGTSAGTPLLAGGFAMVDQLLRAHGRQDLGLANPLIYQIGHGAAAASVLSDVTMIGNDVGPFITSTGAPLGCCAAGPGYDDASGWGSVNLGGFATVALASQPAIVNVGLSLPVHQRPIAAGQIKAAVSCSGKCVLGALAYVKIGRQAPFKVESRLYTLGHAGRKMTLVKFSRGQLTRLRSARAHRTRITATVFGAIVDSAFNIEKKSAGRKLRITG